MSFPVYNNSVRWYHTTYHYLDKWISVNNNIDITPVPNSRPNHKLSKVELLYKRMLNTLYDSYGSRIVKAYNRVNVKQLHLIKLLIDANNQGNLLEVMDFLDPDVDPDPHDNIRCCEFERCMYLNCPTII